MLDIRAMRSEDMPFGLELCRMAGWNQVEPDWQRLLALEPDGVFIAEDDGRACGTASVTCYGTRSGWIGMVLVHSDFRRRGIGTALLHRCISTMQARGVESIKLDATDQGRPVYLKLGFRDERPIWRYAGTRPPGVEPCAGVRRIGAEDWPAIAELDVPAFGADRGRLLRLLERDGPAVVIRDAGGVRGYGFARRGYHASFLGPLVAADPEAARALAGSLLAGLPEGQVFWDVLPDNAAAASLAETLGLRVARRLTRMYLGAAMNPGRVGLVYGAGGFELG